MNTPAKLLNSIALLLSLAVYVSAGAADELKSSASGGTETELAVDPPAPERIALSRRETEEQLHNLSPIDNFKVAVWSRESRAGAPEGQLFTGAMPSTKADFEFLSKLGVKTILNLQGAHTDDGALCLANGLDCVRFPIIAFPMMFSDNPNFQAAFRRLVKEIEAGSKVYVHCLGGKHRTGALVLALKIRNTACGRQFNRTALRGDIDADLTNYGYDGKKYHGILFNWRNDVLNLVNHFERNKWLCE